MKNPSKQLVVVLVTISIAFFSNLNTEAQNLVKSDEAYSIEINDKYVLPQLLKAVMDGNGNLYYCDLTKVLKFDSSGTFIKEIGQSGRGPGEFETLIDCNITEKYLVVYPFNEFRVLFYNKSDLSYSHEFSLESNRSRRFTTLKDSLFVTFNDVSFGETSQALSFYNIDKKSFLGNFIDTPKMAYVGNTSPGGGILSNNNSVFFSYISYAGMWKYDWEKDKVEYFNSVPNYFEESDYKELSRLKIPNDHRYYRGYMFSKSRSEGIYQVGKDKIVQMISTGNPWKSGSYDNSEIKYFLEIWDTEGNKLASEIPTPNNLKIEFTKADKIFFNTGKYFSEESEKLNNGSQLKLFEVYQIEMED